MIPNMNDFIFICDSVYLQELMARRWTSSRRRRRSCRPPPHDMLLPHSSARRGARRVRAPMAPRRDAMRAWCEAICSSGRRTTRVLHECPASLARASPRWAVCSRVAGRFVFQPDGSVGGGKAAAACDDVACPIGEGLVQRQGGEERSTSIETPHASGARCLSGRRTPSSILSAQLATARRQAVATAMAAATARGLASAASQLLVATAGGGTQTCKCEDGYVLFSSALRRDATTAAGTANAPRRQVPSDKRLGDALGIISWCLQLLGGERRCCLSLARCADSDAPRLGVRGRRRRGRRGVGPCRLHRWLEGQALRSSSECPPAAAVEVAPGVALDDAVGGAPDCSCGAAARTSPSYSRDGRRIWQSARSHPRWAAHPRRRATRRATRSPFAAVIRSAAVPPRRCRRRRADAGVSRMRRRVGKCHGPLRVKYPIFWRLTSSPTIARTRCSPAMELERVESDSLRASAARSVSDRRS